MLYEVITIVEQLTYLIFIKDLDENETRNERKAKRGLNHTPIFSADQQNFRWKNLKEMDVNARFTIFTSTEESKGIFPFIRNLGKDVITSYSIHYTKLYDCRKNTASLKGLIRLNLVTFSKPTIASLMN